MSHVRAMIRREGLTLVEMLLVVGLVGMMTAIATISYSAMWGNLHFKRKAQSLADVFQMAQEAAAQSERRYVVAVDYYGYALREYKKRTLDFTATGEQAPDEEQDWFAEDEGLIVSGGFNERFQFSHVYYDDGDDTRDAGESFTSANFLVGKSGWQYGGKVVVLDEDGLPWSIVISRMARPVQLLKGDVPILLPQDKTEVPY